MKKISLSKETLRVLTANEAGLVAGGASRRDDCVTETRPVTVCPDTTTTNTTTGTTTGTTTDPGTSNCPTPTTPAAGCPGGTTTGVTADCTTRPVRTCPV